MPLLRNCALSLAAVEMVGRTVEPALYNFVEFDWNAVIEVAAKK